MSTPNESNKSTQIELLPVELQCRILTGMPNLKTLRALLSASPRFFQVYKTCREVVLSNVGWNQISPTIVPIAMDALEQREDREPTSSLISTLIKEPREIPLETWESLLRFHQIVDSLISNFASSRLVALEKTMMDPHHNTHTQTLNSPCEAAAGGENVNLSKLEYCRLARAFYHLELYSHIKGYSKMGMLSDCWTFVQNLQDWEVEELLCVRSYLIERLIDSLNKFEDEFMKVYLKDRPTIIWPARDCRELSESRSNKYWRSRLFVDDHHHHDQADWIESCLARGLKYLSAVLSANTLPDKFKALDRVEPYYHWISYALSNAETHYDEQKVIAANIERLSSSEEKKNGFHNNNIEQPNEAWFWASESRTYDGNFCTGSDTNDLQRWGYVIWDHARLERLGILTKRPLDVQATIGTDWLIKRKQKSLEARTREQEETWSREGLQSALTDEPRPVFNWAKLWF